MKNKKSIIIGIIFIAVILGSIIFVINYNNSSNIDDYYKYINGKKIEERDIDKEKIGWSYIQDLQDEIDDDVDKLTKKMLDDKKSTNMNVIYNLFNDDRRNKEGIAPLGKYLNMIDNSSNINSLLNSIYNIDGELKIGFFINSQISKDFKDSNKNIIYLYPLNTDFGVDIKFYSNPDYSSYSALVSKYRIRLLKLNGIDAKTSRNTSNDINKILKDIASKSKKTSDFNDVGTYYNIITRDELKEIYSNIDMDKYLRVLKLSNIDTFSIVDKENYKAFNTYLTNDNLNILKEYFKLRIITEYMEFLSDDYIELVYSLNNELNGIDKALDKEEITIDLIETIFDDKISYEYSKDHFTNEHKEKVKSLIDEVLKYYKKNLKSNSFLIKATKDKAISKLDNIKIRIGYPEESVINSDKYVLNESESLFQNIVRINNYIYDENIKLIGTDDDNGSWPFSLTSINAFYNPQDNSINFPAALYKVLDDNSKDYEMLGSVGFTIAHEVTHAFDNNGSLFDENGEFNNWWTKKDLDEFNKRKKSIIDYYNEYEVLGINVDGEKTLGENIADLGAMKCITSIAEEKKAKDEDYKTMYKSFAKFFLSEYIDSYTKMLMIMDTHSPNSVRVNATLSSTNKFYELYNIGIYDKMYKDINSRVNIW